MVRRLFSLLLVSAAAAACSSAGGGATTGDDQNVVPEAAKTLFDQAGVCDNIFKRHAAIRESDMKDGLLRWACGDVPGVTGPDLGQEYCEYHASSGGKLVTKASDVAGAKLECVFTAVYADVKSAVTETAKYAKTLADAMADKANLGVAADPQLTLMKVGFNSRGAATALIHDCEHNANAAPPDEVRQAACYDAWIHEADAGVKKQLETECRGKNLTLDPNWQKVAALGAKVATPADANYDAQHDIAACLRTKAAKGVTWRNSDPMICTRVSRATNECKVDFAPIPDAVEGFTFTGWTNRSLPAGCRFAQVDGKDYPHLVICEASSGDMDDLDTNAAWQGDLQQFCHDRFANDLVMQAPLRALQKSGTTDGPFCQLYDANFTPPKE
jgi:hypothetical protein